MGPRRHSSLGWLLLLAYVWTSAFWASGLVLCFEPDGHVKIEIASSACSDCCPIRAGEGEGDEGGGARDDSRPAPGLGACSCLDVTLDVGSATAKKTQRTELLRAPLAVFEPIRWIFRGARTHAPTSEAWRERASLALTHSVVLRV